MKRIHQYFYYRWFLTLAFAAFLLSSCDEIIRGQKNQYQLISVRVHQVSADKVEERDSYPGIVVPVNEIALRSPIEGMVSHVYVQDDQPIEQHQPLYGLDRPKHEAALQGSQEQLLAARKREEHLRGELAQLEDRQEDTPGAGQKAVQARLDLQEAGRQLALAEAQLEEATANLQNSIIRAPIAGTLGVSRIKPGTEVVQGQTINLIRGRNMIGVDLLAKEARIAKFHSLYTKTPEDSAFMLRLESGAAYPFPGTLAVIDRSPNRQAGTITVRLVFPNPEGQLRKGMRVRVEVVYGDIGEQIVIPQRAVVERDGAFYVYVIQADTVERRVLSLGARARELVVVNSGLEEGETIVLEGKQGLREGSRVRISSVPRRTPEHRNRASQTEIDPD